MHPDQGAPIAARCAKTRGGGRPTRRRDAAPPEVTHGCLVRRALDTSYQKLLLPTAPPDTRARARVTAPFCPRPRHCARARSPPRAAARAWP